ncbi:helix-turn-helix domain-containing protein [Clavibacter sp. Sh2141]|uniref:helix-turn-helix domain-containing protein n=1 Tax=Clavibacter sp. Sh2141 TaxID=3395374 RepID=UPI0039BCE85F
MHGQDGHGIVIVPGRVAAILERFARLDAFRTQVRGQDSELDAVLIDFHAAAVAWRSTEVGTSEAPEPEPIGEWVSTGEAARLLHRTSRGIRKAITERRLPAQLVDGRYRIAREDIAHERARRKEHHG